MYHIILLSLSYLLLSFNYILYIKILKKSCSFHVVQRKKKKKKKRFQISRYNEIKLIPTRWTDESNVHFAKDLFFVCLIFISKQGW